MGITVRELREVLASADPDATLVLLSEGWRELPLEVAAVVDGQVMFGGVDQEMQIRVWSAEVGD
ncbi:hypothetical protein [Pseudoclavibacter sp. 8L]|uniref:hypothetical protein n=1 Tax=Pseudoclavibacter sp. 8L TaxID=2653162 RepID=UPI00135BC9A7|nr:hypothetical protein [Pseudoclavibacter sp. 8L]